MTVDRSLGEIVVSLFESSELGLRRACALRQQGVKQQAPIGLRELDRFLDSQTGDVSTTLHEIWTPVREKLLQVTTDRPKALWICRWLILGKYRQSSITALEDRLASGDHKDAYAASIVFQENANLLNPAEMTPAVRKMVELLQRVGKSGVETKQSFTKLTLACYGIVLDFLGKAAENLESFDIHSLRHICSDFVTISAQYVDSGFSRDFLLSLANSVESSGVERSLPSTDPNQSNQHDVEHLRILCTALNRGLHPRVRNLSKQKYATYIEENKGLTGWTGQITLCCMLSQWRENLMLKIIEDHNLRDILIDLVDKGLETPLLQSSSLVILEYLLDDQIPQKLPELLEAGANQGNQPYSSRLINKLLHGPTSSSVVKTIFDMATTDVGKEGSVALLQQHPQLVTLIYQEMLKDLAGSSLWESTGAPVLLPLLDFPRMLTELCTQLQFKKSTVEQDAIIRRRLVAIMLLDPSSLFVAMIQKIQAVAGAKSPVSSSKDLKDATQYCKLLLQVISDCCKHLPATEWPSLVQRLLPLLYKSPQDPTLVQILSICAPFWTQSDTFNAVFSVIKSWLQNEEQWTASIPPEERIFSTLCPLLVLKVLPMDAFRDIKFSPQFSYPSPQSPTSSNMDDVGDYLFRHLLNGSMEASQLPQIRQLSLEILARFPPEKIVSHLEPLIASAWQERNFAQVRGWMYWLCHALGIWVRQVEGLILQRGVSVAVDIFSGFENDVSESGMQVTRSAIDFIAVIVSLLVTEEIKSGRVPATNLGPAITDISNVKTLENVLSFMCTKLSPQDASQQQLRTSLSNSTVKAFQNLTGQQAESRLLCQLVFDSVLAAAQNEAADTIAFAAHCQVLFHVVYTLTAALKGDRSFSISGGTIQICLKGIQSELEIAQTASVKLLAACLSALPENVPERPSLLHALEKVVTKSRSTNPEGSALAKRVMLGLMARQRA